MKLGICISKAVTAAVLGSTVLWGAGAQDAQAQDRVRWKMQSVYTPELPALGTPAEWLPEQLEMITNGNIEIRAYMPGKLVPPFEIMEAVSDGKIPAGYTWIGYDQGSIPAIFLFSQGLFGMKPWEFMAWNYFKGGNELLDEVYANAGYNIHAELCAMTGPETAGWYHEPITGLDDYDGLKIRFAGLGGEVLKRLGAAVTLLPSGQLFQALETGVIDATEFSIPAVDQVIGFQQIVNHNLYPGWQATFSAFHLLINMKEWEALSEQQQRAVHVACMASVTYTLAESEAKNPAQVKEYLEQDVQLAQIPRSVLEELKRISRDVLAETAAKNEMFNKVWQSQKAFIEDYNEWEKRAYLPAEL